MDATVLLIDRRGVVGGSGGVGEMQGLSSGKSSSSVCSKESRQDGNPSYRE